MMIVVLQNPIKPAILSAVASHVVSGDANDVLLLDSVPMDDTTNPFEVPMPRNRKPQNYLPAWVSLDERGIHIVGKAHDLVYRYN